MCMVCVCFFFFFKQKTAYEMRISDWSSDVFSSDLWSSEPRPGRSFFALMLIEAIVFLIVRYALTWRRLRMALTPKATRSRRVRRRAVEYFKVGAERRTAARVGILLYLSLDERRAEKIGRAHV